MLSGFNHLTLAVTDLDRSVHFYHQLLQLQLDATWDTGAYLSLPGLWLCLSLDPLRDSKPAADYTHYAFTAAAAEFTALVSRLRASDVARRFLYAITLGPGVLAVFGIGGARGRRGGRVSVRAFAWGCGGVWQQTRLIR